MQATTRRGATSVIGAVAVLLTVLATAGVAVAAPDPDQVAEQAAEEVASQIAEVAPPVDVLAPAAVDGELVTEGEVAATTLPTNGDDAVQVAAGADAANVPVLTVSLPDAVAGADGVIADDGTVIYQGDDQTSMAVQGTDDGARIQVVLDSSSAPTRYEFDLGAEITPTLLPDGSVELSAATPDSGIVAVVGLIDAPWALDANGFAVPTYYQVRGHVLVQIVNHRGNYAYPIVADPTVSYGWGVYYNFNKAETKTFAAWGVSGAAGATAACGAIGLIGGPIGVALLSATCGAIAYPLMYKAGVAYNSSPRKCLQVRIIPGIGLSGVSYGTYTGGNCK